MPIMRLISCASARLKREKQDASVTQEKDKALAAALREVEQLKQEGETKRMRISELETLVDERTAGFERLNELVAKEEKVNFSRKEARENAAGSSSKTPAAQAVSMDDALLSFISSGGSSMGSGRIAQSKTGHHFLGASGGEDVVAMALRGM